MVLGLVWDRHQYHIKQFQKSRMTEYFTVFSRGNSYLIFSTARHLHFRSKLNKRKQADEALVSKLKTEEQAMADEVNKLEKGLLLQSNKANELFVTAKQMKGRLISLDARIKETIHKCQWQGYILEVSSDIREMIASNSPIGKLKETVHQKQPVKKVTDMDVHFDGEIDVKTLEDQSNCYIIASTLLSSKLIALADYMNKCVKIVDTQERNLSARYELGSAPVDIAVIDANTFAITLPQQKKIQFLSVKPDYKVVECYAITMNGMCRKIACQRDKVIVAYTEHIEILDTFGYVQKTIAPRDVKQLEGIAFADDSKAFYVSNNSDRKCIRKFDFEGKLLATYEDKYLLEVRGITVTRDGTVLACNWAENASVHVITPDCQKSKEILTRDGHAKRPICVCYCDESGKLYLANNKYNIEPTQRNTLKIFQLC